MAKPDYKYKASFSSELIGLGDSNCSKASEIWPDLSKLEGLFPESFDIKNNPDVFPHVIPMAVANRFNRNGEGIDFAGAKQIKERLVHKYIDWEHDSSYIIGSILNVGFSSMDTDEIFDGDEDAPFFINSAGLLYREAHAGMIQKIAESADMMSSTFGQYSASWEIGYSDYKIYLGSSKLSECEVISDASQKEEFKKYLRMEGGSGYTKDGVAVYRMLCGMLYPLGIGIVRKPAAYVRGLYGVGNDEKPSFSSEKAKKIFHIQSQVKNNNVKFERTVMDEQILKLLQEIQDKLNKPDNATSVAAVGGSLKELTDVIRKQNETYVEDKRKSDEAKTLADEAKNKAEVELKALKESFDANKAELDTLKAQLNDSSARVLFSQRMEKFDETFKIDDETRKIIADEIKALAGEDAAFDAYLVKAKVLLKGREKTDEEKSSLTLAASILEKTKDGKVSIEDITTALASAEIEISNVANTTNPNLNSTKERWAKAFEVETSADVKNK